MNSILIRFPFSSINDEQYELVLYTSTSGYQTNAITAMNADSNFRHTSDEQIGENYVQTFEGTLVGDVSSEDSDREDVFVPLLESKLKFNMACQQFPTWLMDICQYYTNVKVVLSVMYGGARIERWRGYLMANTLNMTVVNDLMACPLVAVDEIGMAKYLKFNENLNEQYGAYYSLLGLLGNYWTLNQTNFNEVYKILGLTAAGTLFVVRDMAYTDDDGDGDSNIVGNFCVNLHQYYIDRDATWADVIGDAMEYLGMVIGTGNKGPLGNDCYILSSADYGYEHYKVYHFGSTSYQTGNSRMFDDFGNQQKVGADFQATCSPCEWKGVKVKSLPQRPPVHEYLNKDNVKAIEPASGHEEWCETRIGKKTEVSSTIDDFKYRVFQYTQLVDKEDQYIPEASYVNMENCGVATAARAVGIGQGYFPLTDSALGRNRPDGNDTDSLDFALSKIGMITARIGTYETPRQKISADLKDYFVILNNAWGRLYWDDDSVVSDTIGNPSTIAEFMPFAGDRSIRPSNDSYLSIDMSALFINENIGDDICTTNQAVTPNTMVDDFEGLIQAVFPITESYHQWNNGDVAAVYTGSLVGNSHNHVTSNYPFIYARLSIGGWFWDGSAWVHVESGNAGPWFQLPLIPTGETTKYWMVGTGYMHGEVNNYYYTECRPRVGASDNIFRIPLSGLSSHSQPLEGRVMLEIGGRVPFFNAYKPTVGDMRYNNILFVLLSEIEVKYTDAAEIAEKDIETFGKFEVDPYSTTKKTKEVELQMSTPSVDGIFSNCMLYDGGKAWHNLQHVHRAGGADTTPEAIKAEEMAAVYCGDQVTVEFSREFDGVNTDNIYNVGFTVSNLTEVAGTFMPLTRKFNWTKGTVRWKLQKVAD